MFEFRYFQTIDSTSAAVVRLWPELGGGWLSGLLVRARVQTAGVGRSGRRWSSPAGGLWFSVGWPARRDMNHYQQVSIAVGLAVAEAIEQVCGLFCQLKWPNDLLASDRKLGGILCNLQPVAGQWLLVAGVGINGNYPVQRIDSPTRWPATTLAEELGRPVDLDVLTRACAERLSVALRDYDRAGLLPLLPAVRRRLAWLGAAVSCLGPDGEPVAGTLVNIDGYGNLVLETAAGRRHFAVGDLSKIHRSD